MFFLATKVLDDECWYIAMRITYREGMQSVWFNKIVDMFLILRFLWTNKIFF